MTFFLDKNSLTGSIKGECEYRHSQKDSTAYIDETGKIDYNLTLGSGTGIAEVNTVWYSDKTLGLSENVNLFSLAFNRFGHTFFTSFQGASGNGNIKGVRIENSSSFDIGVKLPFSNFKDYFIVPPSGAVLMSNIRGWEIQPTGAIVQLSGNGTNQKYNMSLIGAALPLILNVGNVIPIEYKSSAVFDTSMKIEYNTEIIGSTSNIIPFEYLETGPSGTSDTPVPFEYMGAISGFGASGAGSSINIEYRGELLSFHEIPIEYRAFAVSGELVQNPLFLFGGSSYTNSDDGVDPSSLPPWDLIWPTGTTVQMPTNPIVTGYNGEMLEVECKHFFAVWRFGPNGQGFNFNYMLIGSVWTLFSRGHYQLRQTVHNVTPGATYRIQFAHELAFDTLHRAGSKRPSFNVYSRSGATLLNNVYSDTSEGEQIQQFTIVAPDDVFIIEWDVPQHLDDPVTWQPDWSYTDQDYQETLNEWTLAWFVRDPSVKPI